VNISVVLLDVRDTLAGVAAVRAVLVFLHVHSQGPDRGSHVGTEVAVAAL